MQMRTHHHVNIRRSQPVARKIAHVLRGFQLVPERRAGPFLVVADAGINQNVAPARADQEAVKAKADPVGRAVEQEILHPVQIAINR